MTSGLINIVTYGGQDLFLTGNPEITHFKAVYRRHTNFSVQSYKLNFDDKVNFGREIHIEIPRIGDLMSKTYLEITLPEIAIVKQVKDLNKYKQVVIDRSAITEVYRQNVIKVSKFIELNMEAYRGVVEQYKASNTDKNYIDDMIDAIYSKFSLTSVGTTEYDQNTKIIEDFEQLISQQDSNNQVLFDYRNISLQYIAETATEYLQYIESESYRIDLFLKIESAIDLGYTVMKYYTDLYYEDTKKLQDIIPPINYKFAWTDRIGHSIIEYVDIFIGGEKIDRHYGIWLDIWYELTGKKEQNDTYMKMIGNVPELTTYDRTTKPSYILQIPFQFWFCRHNGSAIPLVALEYNKVSFTIKLRNFEEVAYIEDYDPSNDNFIQRPDLKVYYEEQGLSLNAYLVVDYVFLDGPERRKFAQSGHEYLIEQLQYYTTNMISKEIYSTRIDFNHPVKELIWVAQKADRVGITDTGGIVADVSSKNFQWTNYGINSDYSDNPILQSKLDFNSYERVIPLDGNYFNYVQPYYHHSNTPKDGVNVYSFSLYPEEVQPSGSCNFTRLSNVLLTILVDDSLVKPVTSQISTGEIVTQEGGYILWIFAINMNILRVIGGFGALAY